MRQEDGKSSSKGFNHNVAWQSDQVAEAYDGRRFTSLGGRMFDSMEKKHLNRMLDIIDADTANESLLELACGTGRISAEFAKRRYKMVCGDISEQMITEAKKRLAAMGRSDVEFTIQDIYNMDFDDGSFDCVAAFRLFQHLTSEERARALTEMARVSKRYVLVNVMYTSAYYEFIRGLRKILGRYAPRYTASQAETNTELKASGLRIAKSALTQPGFNGNRILLLEKV